MKKKNGWHRKNGSKRLRPKLRRLFGVCFFDKLDLQILLNSLSAFACDEWQRRLGRERERERWFLWRQDMFGFLHIHLHKLTLTHTHTHTHTRAYIYIYIYIYISVCMCIKFADWMYVFICSFVYVFTRLYRKKFSVQQNNTLQFIF